MIFLLNFHLFRKKLKKEKNEEGKTGNNAINYRTGCF